MKKNWLKTTVFPAISVLALTPFFSSVAHADSFQIPLLRFATVTNPRSACLPLPVRRMEAVSITKKWIASMSKTPGFSARVIDDAPSPTLDLSISPSNDRLVEASQLLSKVFKDPGFSLQVMTGNETIINNPDFRVGDVSPGISVNGKTVRLFYLKVKDRILPFISVVIANPTGNEWGRNCSIGPLPHPITPNTPFQYSIDGKTYRIVLGKERHV